MDDPWADATRVDENGALHVDLDGRDRYDVDPSATVGWGLEFNDLAMVRLRTARSETATYGRFSSAEAARALFSRAVPLRLVYG